MIDLNKEYGGVSFLKFMVCTYHTVDGACYARWDSEEFRACAVPFLTAFKKAVFEGDPRVTTEDVVFALGGFGRLLYSSYREPEKTQEFWDDQGFISDFIEWTCPEDGEFWDKYQEEHPDEFGVTVGMSEENAKAFKKLANFFEENKEEIVEDCKKNGPMKIGL